MEVDELLRVFNAGYSLQEFLTFLGRDCLDNLDSLRIEQYGEWSDLHINVRDEVALASRELWAPDGSFLAGPDEGLERRIRKLDVTPRLAIICVLEGICFGVATDYFTWIADVVTIERGMVMPLPKRHLRDWKDATPNPLTLRRQILDPKCGFVIWNLDWVLELDFTFRDRIDDICWPVSDNAPEEPRRLPHIASVHPFLGTDMWIPPVDQGRFFGVQPIAGTTESRERNAQIVVAALRTAADHAQIAVVPEFALHTPDALSALLDETGAPPIVVSGSAHCEDGGQRCNTSITYLDGVELLKISKQYAFVYRQRVAADDPNASRKVEQSSTENIAPRKSVLRVAASSSTRLAVTICSDLNSVDFPPVLIKAAVNILLCPAWTPKDGTFSAAIKNVASFSQCVSLIANTPGHPDVEGDPFWAMTQVPRGGADPVCHWSTDGHRVGVLNPNLPPADAEHFVWKPSSGS